jgi:glycosyltransferase involved in cell wall biosynthesis
MYETTRELCVAECALGHEAKLVDTTWVENETAPPDTFRFDRGVDVATNEWAAEAEVHVLHSRIPPDLYGKKPIVMMLHGAPEYLFYSQVFRHKDGDGSHATILQYGNDENIRAFVTMWERHVPYWQAILGDDRVSLIPPIVNMGDYSPDGDQEDLKDERAEFNIGFCDTWRPTFYKEPFQVIAGVREYWKKNQDSKFHIFGIPTEAKRARVYGNIWDRHILAIQRQGDFFGVIWELHPDMARVYRTLDVVVTMAVDENRIVRETLASGRPLVAPLGNKHTPYTCQIDNPYSVAEVLEKVRKDLQESPDAVRDRSLESVKAMGVESCAEKFLSVVESIL